MTLQQIIEQYEAARRPTPLNDDVATLTARGAAGVAIHRLGRQLRELERPDLAVAAGMLSQLADELCDGLSA